MIFSEILFCSPLLNLKTLHYTLSRNIEHGHLVFRVYTQTTVEKDNNCNYVLKNTYIFLYLILLLITLYNKNVWHFLNLNYFKPLFFKLITHFIFRSHASWKNKWIVYRVFWYYFSRSDRGKDLDDKQKWLLCKYNGLLSCSSIKEQALLR